MAKSKNKFNWYFIIVGLFLLLGYFYPKKEPVNDSNLTTKKVTLSHNIELIKGDSRSRSFHRLWTKETKAAFIIDVPGEIAANWTALDSLTEGDPLTIKYDNNRETDLEDGAKEIPIYFLQKFDKLYFDTPAYNQSKEAYVKRWEVLMLIGGLLLALYGLTIINSKVASVIAAVSFLTIIIMRILNKF